QKPDGYGFGSYCYDGRCLAFVGFFPNFIYNFAWLKNLYFSSSSRARAMSARFAHDDGSDQFSQNCPPRQNPQQNFWREVTWNMDLQPQKKGEFLMHNRKEKR